MRQLRMPAVALALIGVGLAAYTNCAKVNFEANTAPKVEAAGSATTTSTPTVEEAIASCANAAKNGTLVTLQKVVRFEDPKTETGRAVVCEWGKDDNLDQENDFLTARYEQAASIQLPANSVLCAAEMNSTASTFTYDDMFYLTLNDYVVASSLKSSLARLQTEMITVSNSAVEPAYKYSWLGVRKASFAGVNETSDNYCFGKANGVGSCQWPNSEKSGPFSLRYDPALVVALGLKASGGNQQFKFITTGDNDPSTDCSHDRLDLNVQYSYYLTK